MHTHLTQMRCQRGKRNAEGGFGTPSLSPWVIIRSRLPKHALTMRLRRCGSHRSAARWTSTRSRAVNSYNSLKQWRKTWDAFGVEITRPSFAADENEPLPNLHLPGPLRSCSKVAVLDSCDSCDSCLPFLFSLWTYGSSLSFIFLSLTSYAPMRPKEV